MTPATGESLGPIINITVNSREFKTLMSYDWEIKEGDSLPELDVQIRDPSGDVADLSTAESVEFRMAHVRTDTLLVATDATISDGATGRATYDLKTEDTGMEGLHAVEWRVTRSSGETYSYPQNGNQEVFIHEGVGRDLSSVSTPNGDYTVDSLTADSISTEQLFSDQQPDVIVYRDGSDAVALNMSSASVVAKQNATTNGLDVISQAIKSLPKGTSNDGGHVYIRNGRYSTDSADINGEPLIGIDRDNVTLTGDGRSTLITLEDGATQTDEGAKIIHVGGDDTADGWNGTNSYDGFSICNLKIDGNYQNQGNIPDPYDGHNIQIQGANFLVHNVWSINSTGDGVEPISRSDPAPTKRGIVSNCVFRDNYEQCIHPHGITDSVFIGNVCDGEVNNDVVNLFSHHVDNERLIFANNHILNGQENGVMMTNATEYTNKDIVFVGNTAMNNQGSGILLTGGTIDGVHVADNYIAENAGSGISITGNQNITIKNNTIARNDGSGINGGTSGGPITNLTISDNYIHNNNRGGNGASGILLSANGNDITNLNIAANQIISDTSPLYSFSILMNESTAATYSDLYIQNNYCVGHDGGPMIKNDFGAVRRGNYGDRVNDKMSSPPSTATFGDIYLDDGTNTASGTFGFRIFDSGVWNDIGAN